MYDLAIIGAGVASASALITLQNQNLKIALVAPQNPIPFRIGETLSPVANRELEKLGIYGEFQKENHFKAHTKFSSWGSPLLQEHYTWEGQQQTGWYLDRINFEQFLWKYALQTQIKNYKTKVVTAKLDKKIWHLTTLDKKQIQCRFVMDCSGRSGIITRTYANRKRLDKLVCLYTVIKQQPTSKISPTVAAVIESVENGWFYSSLIPNNGLVVSYFTDSDLIPKKAISLWENFVQKNSIYTAKRIKSAEFINTDKAKTVDASTIISTKIADNYFLAAGDSGASFDPLSSHGITTALWSGRKGAQAIAAWHSTNSDSKLQQYQQTFCNGIEKYLQEKEQIYSRENRFRQHQFWQRRQFTK